MDDDDGGGKKFTRKCPNEAVECPGFLSEDYHCSLCDTFFCEKCNARIGQNHECDPADVETVKLIKRDSKPCPKCGIFITKIEGCSQMWCTKCHCCWNFRTGAIQRGRIHNPHYVEFRRAGGTTGRELGDIPCGGIPCFNELRQHSVEWHILDWRIELSHVLRTLDWLEHETYSTRRPRILYMTRRMSLECYKREIQRLDKRREKHGELRLLYEMFSNTTGDMLRQYLLAQTAKERDTIIENINDVVEYTNENIRDLRERYKCITPRLLERIQVPTPEIIDVT